MLRPRDSYRILPSVITPRVQDTVRLRARVYRKSVLKRTRTDTTTCVAARQIKATTDLMKQANNTALHATFASLRSCSLAFSLRNTVHTTWIDRTIKLPIPVMPHGSSPLVQKATMEERVSPYLSSNDPAKSPVTMLDNVPARNNRLICSMPNALPCGGVDATERREKRGTSVNLRSIVVMKTTRANALASSRMYITVYSSPLDMNVHPCWWVDFVRSSKRSGTRIENSTETARFVVAQIYGESSTRGIRQPEGLRQRSTVSWMVSRSLSHFIYLFSSRPNKIHC